MKGTALKIVAHRGASFDAPENTIASARLGWEQNADGLECDVHLTRDDQLVVIHDESLQRTAGVPGFVEDKTLAELKRLDFGSWKSDRFSGEKIPTLEELLRTVPAGKLAVVEIKTKHDVSAQLASAIAAAKIDDSQVRLISFDFELLKIIKAKLPRYAALWLVGGSCARGEAEVTLSGLTDRCREANFDGLNLSQEWPINRAFVEQVHRADFELGVWTVDDPHLAQSLAQAGVDFIATNRPGAMRR